MTTESLRELRDEFDLLNTMEDAVRCNPTYQPNIQAAGEQSKRVEALLEKAIAQAEAMEAQAIGEQTPVAWMKPRNVGPSRMFITHEDWKCSSAGGTNRTIWTIPLYRSPMSSEARDKAIEALETVIDLWKDELINEGYDTSANFDKATQALSALRGDQPPTISPN